MEADPDLAVEMLARVEMSRFEIGPQRTQQCIITLRLLLQQKVPVKIGRAHVRTPVTNAHLVCRLLLEKKKSLQNIISYKGKCPLLPTLQIDISDITHTQVACLVSSNT